MKRGREVGEIDGMAMANCLMLLSKVGQTDASQHHYEGGGGRVFACKTCNKRFPSFQALGGHRASHKKPRLTGGDAPEMPVSPKKPKTHECSICGLEFAIGQALGGHMRTHRAALVTRDLLPEMDKWSGDETDSGLDLSLTPWGTDLELKLGIVHCFI
ncbi:hypothetical protein like AT2G28710 [Hibiscus trionum]|uniref:C2H2-type domain-containing protein n=1 Tax=Hibiscus trionum TaxID=183268 RepID=A0A9W7J6C7_HIBTR|nr:hypothetical protein like AT2G28710 [Hibiscus trionum]